MGGVTVRDARATPADRLWIQSVYRDYLDDLALGTGIFPALGEVGHREPDQLFHWFDRPNSFPLVILRSSEPVGFALVVRGTPGLGARTAVAVAAVPGAASPSRPPIGSRPKPRAASRAFT